MKMPPSVIHMRKQKPARSSDLPRKHRLLTAAEGSPLLPPREMFKSRSSWAPRIIFQVEITMNFFQAVSVTICKKKKKRQIPGASYRKGVLLVWWFISKILLDEKAGPICPFLCSILVWSKQTGVYIKLFKICLWSQMTPSLLCPSLQTGEDPGNEVRWGGVLLVDNPWVDSFLGAPLSDGSREHWRLKWGKRWDQLWTEGMILLTSIPIPLSHLWRRPLS